MSLMPPVNRAYDLQFLQNAKENCLNMLKYSNKEYEEYVKNRKNITHLQQAGNKLFNVIENLIEYVEQRDYSVYGQFMAYTQSKELKGLLRKAKEMHLFFYGGLNEGNPNDVEKVYLQVYERVKNKIYNLK